MPIQKLTAKTIENLKPRESRYEVFDADTPGLALRVSPNGSKTWSYFYRQGGRLRRFTLGPLTPKLGLKQARKRAIAARADVNDGGNPAAAKAEAKLDAKATVSALVEQYAREPLVAAKRSWHEEKRALDVDVLPYWGERPLNSIRRADVRALIAAKAKGTEDRKGAPVMANRLLAYVSHLLNYAVDLDLIDANPAARLKKLPETSRERVYSREELRALWNYCTKGEVPDGAKDPKWSQAMRDLFAALIATGQRLNEVAKMRWADLDLDTRWWTLPSQATKNKLAHRVPISAPVLDILARRRPAGDEEAERQVFVFSLSPATNIYARSRKAMAALCRGFKWEGLHAHDARRTCATGLGELGIPEHIIAATLNHKRGGVTAIYNRFRYDVEKRAALDKWAERVVTIAEGRKADVVQIPAANDTKTA